MTTTDTRIPLVESIEGTSELLQISRASVYRAAERGDLKLVKIGGRSMITRESIERLVGAA
jgi:hypothetical protein